MTQQAGLQVVVRDWFAHHKRSPTGLGYQRRGAPDPTKWRRGPRIAHTARRRRLAVASVAATATARLAVASAAAAAPANIVVAATARSKEEGRLTAGKTRVHPVRPLVLVLRRLSTRGVGTQGFFSLLISSMVSVAFREQGYSRLLCSGFVYREIV